MNKWFAEWKRLERVSSKPKRWVIVGILVVFGLYFASSFGERVGRALYYITH